MLLVAVAIAQILALVFRRSKWVRKLEEFFGISIILRMYTGTYLEFLCAAALQLKVLTFGKFPFVFSSVSAIISFNVSLLFPAYCYFIIKTKIKNRLSIRKYIAIADDLDMNHPIKKYFVVFLAIRRVLHIMC